VVTCKDLSVLSAPLTVHMNILLNVEATVFIPATLHDNIPAHSPINTIPSASMSHPLVIPSANCYDIRYVIIGHNPYPDDIVPYFGSA